MKTGEVVIDFENLIKDYPLSTDHILEILSDKKSVSFKVNEEDNDYFDPEENEYRVRIEYPETESKTISFTLLLEEKYLTFK